MNTSNTLDGKVALVTGGGRGIGRACAIELAKAGADVIVCSRTMREVSAVQEEIHGLDRKAIAVEGDMTDPDQVRLLAQEVIDLWGRVDILVNNVGLGRSHRFLDHPDDLWHQMLAVNLTSVYYVSKVFVPKMIEQRRGRIINIASTASKIGSRYIAAYVAAKHGVLGLTRALAAELVSYNITVNAVCPGYVDTPMTDGNIANIVAKTGMPEAEARKTLEKLSPQNRMIESEEVAAMVVMLASDIAQGINGQAINIDGGAVMF